MDVDIYIYICLHIWIYDIWSIIDMSRIPDAFYPRRCQHTPHVDPNVFYIQIPSLPKLIKQENHHLDKEIHPGKFTWNLQNHPIEFRKIIWSIHRHFEVEKNVTVIFQWKIPQQTSKNIPPIRSSNLREWPATTSIALAHRTSIRCCWRHGTCDPIPRIKHPRFVWTWNKRPKNWRKLRCQIKRSRY